MFIHKYVRTSRNVGASYFLLATFHTPLATCQSSVLFTSGANSFLYFCSSIPWPPARTCAAPAAPAGPVVSVGHTF